MSRKNYKLCALMLLLLVPLFLSTPIMPSATAQPSSTTKKILFYLHNNTATPYVNGYQTFYTMNTSQQWSTTPTIVKNIQKLNHYWYLYPTLASNYTLSGKISFGLWINATGVTPSGTPTLTLYERDASGTETQVYSYTFGSTRLYNVPSYLNLTATTTPVIFREGSSIKLVFEIVVGASNYAQIWFDTYTYDSNLILESADYMLVSSVKTYDFNGAERTIFSVIWNTTERNVTIRANVTDPFGGYDIYRVQVTVTNPLGTAVVLNQAMNKFSGTSFSFLNNYEFVWAYPTDAVLGNYSVTVTAIDNTGYAYYNGAMGVYGSYGPYEEHGYTSFFMGSPFFVQIRTLDTHANVLNSAYIEAVSSGVTIEKGYTNASGWWTATLYSGYYNVKVYWQGTSVATQPLNVTESTSLTITCSVYYPAFKVVDDVDSALPEAQLYLTSPNGTTNIVPFYTDAKGFFNLTKIAGGSYKFTILWKGVVVYDTTLTVNSDGPYTLKTHVYKLTVKVLGNNAAPVYGAYVIVYTQSLVGYGLETTDAAGEAVFRLPEGTYRIDARYSSVYWLTVVTASATESAISVTTSNTKTIILADYPPAIWLTTAFWLLMALVAVSAFAAIYVVFLSHRRIPLLSRRKA